MMYVYILIMSYFDLFLFVKKHAQFALSVNNYQILEVGGKYGKSHFQKLFSSLVIISRLQYMMYFSFLFVIVDGCI